MSWSWSSSPRTISDCLRCGTCLVRPVPSPMKSMQIQVYLDRGSQPESGSAAQTCHSVRFTSVPKLSSDVPSIVLHRMWPVSIPMKEKYGKVWKSIKMYKESGDKTAVSPALELNLALMHSPSQPYIGAPDKWHVQVVGSWAQVFHLLALS